VRIVTRSDDAWRRWFRLLESRRWPHERVIAAADRRGVGAKSICEENFHRHESVRRTGLHLVVRRSHARTRTPVVQYVYVRQSRETGSASAPRKDEVAEQRLSATDEGRCTRVPGRIAERLFMADSGLWH
jgi:hypothetical protein